MSDVPFAFGLVSIQRRKSVPFDPGGEDRIVDGDTIMIGGQTYRLDGFDAPELGKPHCAEEYELAEQAKVKLEEFVLGAAMRGTLNITVLDKPDARGRPMLLVTIDGWPLADLMVEAGLAHAYDGRGPKEPFCQCQERWTSYNEGWARAEEAQRRRLAQKRAARRAAAEAAPVIEAAADPDTTEPRA